MLVSLISSFALSIFIPKANAASNLPIHLNPSEQIYYEISPKRKALLDTIAYAEGTDRSIDSFRSGYNLLYSFQTFIPSKSHPNKVICASGLCSSAAGRYQILNTTFFNIQRSLTQTGFKPFSSFAPIYQDQAALFLIDSKYHCLDDLESGNLQKVFDLISWEWASISPSRYGQSTLSRKQLIRLFYLYLGLYQ